MNIPRTISGDAPKVVIAPIQDDNIVIRPNNNFVIANVGVFESGLPNTILEVDKTNYRDILGGPILNGSYGWEYSRQLEEAIADVDTAYIVRVVSDNYRAASISMDTSGVWSSTSVGELLNYVNSFANATELLKFEVKDGNSRNDRKIGLSLDSNEIFRYRLYEKDNLGISRVVEDFEFSLDKTAKDDLNQSLFIENVFKERSTRIKAYLNSNATINYTTLTDTSTSKIPLSVFSTKNPDLSADASFFGTLDANVSGNDADLDTNKDTLFTAGWELFNSFEMELTAIYSGGDLSRTSAIADKIKEIAENKRVMAFIDLQAGITPSAALMVVSSGVYSGIDSHFVSILYNGFTSADNLESGNPEVALGVSGAGVRSMARGHNEVVGNLPGIKNGIGGSNRGNVARNNIKIESGNRRIDGDRFVQNRLNYYKIDGYGTYLFTSLTSNKKNNSLRYFHVANTVAYISRQLYSMAVRFLQEPIDNVINILNDRHTTFLNDLLNAEQIGNFEYSIEQRSLDTIGITLGIQPIGIANIIHIEPIVLPVGQ